MFVLNCIRILKCQVVGLYHNFKKSSLYISVVDVPSSITSYTLSVIKTFDIAMRDSFLPNKVTNQKAQSGIAISYHF
jgi:hypothetical protein